MRLLEMERNKTVAKHQDATAIDRPKRLLCMSAHEYECVSMHLFV